MEREIILGNIRYKFEKKLSIRSDDSHLSHVMQYFGLHMPRVEF